MAATEQFSLRWNNFHSNIASGFHDLLLAADLVDVTLAVEGQFLHAHKLVLSICSPYFKEMFKMNPCKHPIIILKDVTHKNLKDILEFMYLGEVNVLRENLPLFLQTAELLQVKGLSCDDTHSNSSKSSTRSNTIKLESLDDPGLEDDFLDENQSTTTQIPTNNKRTKPTVNSNSKKAKHAIEELSNKNHVGAKEEPADDRTQTESPNATCNDNIPFDTDEFLMELKQNNDSGIASMNISGNSELSSQEASGSGNVLVSNLINGDGDYTILDIVTFYVDEKGHVYCPYCYKKFVNRYNLKVHIRDKHDSSVSNLDCVICKKTMRNKSCLRVHMYHHRKQEQMIEQAKQQGLQKKRLRPKRIAN